MKAKINKLLALLTCFVMLFVTINVTTVFASESDWLTEEQITIPSEYDFSFMAIGDTQIVTRYDANGLVKIYDYVISNVQKKNVKHVLGLGDITDADTDWEWDRATKQIARMDGVVPYSIIRGNHDIYSTQFVGTDNKRSLNKESTFDKLYGKADSVYAQQYAKQYTYCYEYAGEGKENFRARNTVHFFSSSSRDYMVVALDYGPNDDILAWANGIIESHPYHNVIITTHSYLEADGSTADSGEGTVPTRDYKNEGANDGNEMWEKLISKHANIVMVICGHKPHDQVLMVKRNGVNGNEVTQFLIDPQGMDVGDSKGMVATFYVEEDKNQMTVEWYSAIKGKYYKENNNYTFEVNAIERHLYGNVSFDANGGSGEIENVDVYSSTFALPECTFTSPDRKHVFKGWSLAPNGEIIDAESVAIDGNTTFYAIWEEIELPMNKVTVKGGTITPVAELYKMWDVITIKADEPKEGKRFTGWYGLNGLTLLSGNSSSMEVTFEMPNKAITLTAMYEDITYVISASAGANGKISKSGSVLVKEGKDYTFNFTPNQGYKIKDVLVDGVSVGAVESYTFENVTKDCSISVSFEKIETTPEQNPPTPPENNENGGGNESGSSGCGSSADAGSTTILVTLSLAVLMVLKRIKG